MTALSRRRLLVGIGTAGAVAAVPTRAGAAPSGATRVRRLDLATCTAETFTPHIGTRFRLRRPGAIAVSLRLAAVERASNDDATSSFSLLFRAPRDEAIPQGTYRLTHQELGRFRVLLVPVGDRTLEAVFNHLRG